MQGSGLTETGTVWVGRDTQRSSTLKIEPQAGWKGARYSQAGATMLVVPVHRLPGLLSLGVCSRVLDGVQGMSIPR
jgi:hypothetical protein